MKKRTYANATEKRSSLPATSPAQLAIAARAPEQPQPDIAAQLDAARLGHSFGAIGVGAAPALAPVQRMEMPEHDEDEKKGVRQTKRASGKEDALSASAAAVPNGTGLPDQLKAGVEHLSGMALDDVNVHYNSAKPADVQALAYTQGAEIHVAPGQEQHLPHEAWHVAQQKQGRVQPTMQMKGVEINDDQGLEHEADVMGAQAMLQAKHSLSYQNKPGAVAKQNVGKRVVRKLIQRQAEDDDVLKTNDASKISQRIEELLEALEAGKEIKNHSARLNDLMNAVSGVRGEAREKIAGSASLRGSTQGSPTSSPPPEQKISTAFNQTMGLGLQLAAWRLRIEELKKKH